MANYPGNPASITFDTASKYASGCKIDSAPTGSTLEGKWFSIVGTGTSLGGGMYRHTFTFTPDKGGIYGITTPVGATTVAVAEQLTRQLSAHEPASSRSHIATVTIYMVASTVEPGPKLTMDERSGTQMARIAAEDPNVVAALAALAGKTATQVHDTYWANLVTAWTNACTLPTANPTVDTGVAALLADGWVKDGKP